MNVKIPSPVFLSSIPSILLILLSSKNFCKANPQKARQCNGHEKGSNFSESFTFDDIDFEIEPSPPLMCQDGQYYQANITNDNLSLFSAHQDGRLELHNNMIVLGRNNICFKESNSVDDEEGFHRSVTFCSANCSSSNPCLKKCCNWEMQLNQTYDCEASPLEVGQTSFLDDNQLKGLYHDVDDSDQLDRFNFLTDHRPPCATPVRLESRFQILENGNVKIGWGHHSWVELDDYCMENFPSHDPTNPNGQTWKNKLIIFYCPSQLTKTIGAFVKIQMIYCGVSWIFVLLTLVIYLILWRKHSITGWTQVAFLFSTFFYFFMRFIRSNIKLANEFSSSTILVEKADIFFTFGLLANLVNLSFHMFCTFYKPQPQQLIRNWRDLKRLYLSVSICWTFSGVITITDCLFEDFDTIVQVQISVLAVLLALNALLVFASAIVLWKQMMNSKSISTAGKDQKMMISLFLRLFFLTGMIWSLKILEQFVRTDSYERGWFWDTVQFITYTYGVAIFFVFVLNPRIIKGLQERFPMFRKAGYGIRAKMERSQELTVRPMTTVMTINDKE